MKTGGRSEAAVTARRLDYIKFREQGELLQQRKHS